MQGGLEAVAKGAAIFGIAAYVIGLATVSFYLRQLDVTIPDPSALKARFVLTGSVMIGLAAISLAGPLVGDRLSRLRALDWFIRAPGAHPENVREAAPPPRRPAYLIAGLVAPLVLMILAFGLANASNWDDSNLYVYAATAYLAAFIAALAFLLTTLAVIGKIERDFGRPTLVATLSAVTLGVTYFYISFMAANLYPHVPQQFGGGRPKREQLLFKHEAANEAKQLGMHVSPARPLSQPVAVIFQGNGIRAVEVPGKGIIEVSDSLIIGAIPAE